MFMVIRTQTKILTAALLAAAGVVTARADSLTWDPAMSGGSGGAGTWDLNSTANWWNGASDVAWKDNSARGTNSALFSNSAGTVTLNTSLSASNLQFTAAGYTVSGSGTLTLGAGGIDASSVSSGVTTIGNPLFLSAGQQPWLVGSGSTLAINGAVSRANGATVDFSSTGVTSSTLANVNGILGGWATVSAISSGGGDWAANDGSGNIVVYSGYTDVSGVAITNSTGTDVQNWKNATAVTLLATNALVNSLYQLNDFTVSNGCTLTLGSGGLMLASSSRWMLAGSSTSSYLKSGASSGELFVHVPDSGSGGNWTLWPLIADNGGTPLILVKDGAGLVKLGNNNSYTGGTIVNGGVLAARDAVPAGAVTPFGSGDVTLNNGVQLELGTDPGAAFGSYIYANNIAVNSGAIYAFDGSHRITGNLNVGSGGLAIGSTFDAPWEGFVETNFPKALFVDGLVTGTGNMTVQDPGYASGNAWNTSCSVFTSQGTAAQNTYSGTVTVNPFVVTGSGGNYLYIVGTNVFANATINLTGDNLAATGRMGIYTLLFGNGSIDGPGYVTIGGLAGSGSLLLNDTILFTGGSGYSNGIPVALTVGYNNSSTTYSGAMNGDGSLIKTGLGTLTLSGTNTYTGNTTVNGGTLALSGTGSIVSSNIVVARGATFDVSAVSGFTLSGSQALWGSGAVNGSFTASSGSQIYADNGSGYGTNAFNNNLILASGSAIHFNLSDLASGSNDRLTVGGTLTANNNAIHISAPSTLDNLDTSDYVLISSPNTLSGSFGGIVWDVQPANAAHYSLVASGGTLTLHYTAVTSPGAGGVATPSPALRNQTVLITVTATNGTGGSVNSVTVDASPIGGSSSLALVSAGGNIWTNSVVVTPGTAAGAKSLTATITDTVPLSTIISIPLTVVVGNDVWNGSGGDDNFSTGFNWTNQLAPGYIGDSLEFAGTTRLSPNMDNNYTITSLLFDSGAGAFNISSGNTLTFSSGASISNSSVNPQILNLTVVGTGNLSKSGSGMVVLSGNSTIGGAVSVNGGILGVSSTLTATNILIGNKTNAVAALYQTGGNISAATGTGFDNLSIGNLDGSYGYYNAESGSATLNGIAIAGEDNNGSSANFSAPAGNGVMDVNGGNVNCTGWLVVTRNANAQMGVLNIYNGSLSFAGGGLVCNWGGGQTSMINVMGGNLSSVNNYIGFLGGTGVLNLLGGVTSVTAVNGAWSTPSGQVNFNGGTLQAAVNTTNFLAVTRATIYSGGATIDNNGFPVTIAQPLTAPTGNGVSAVTSFTGGSGYFAPPIVTIAPGSGDTTGTGATAIAQIDPAAGTVTNILITCPGMNYTATPTFTFTGGGAITPASVTGVTLETNTSGGLTLIGFGGTVTLSGANTYTGDTAINNDTLMLTGSLASTNIITQSGTVFDVSGLTNYTVNAGQALSGFGNVNGSVNAAASSMVYGGTDGTYGTLTFNNDLTLASGAACYLDLGTTYNGANDQIVVNGTLTANGNSIHIKAPDTLSSLDSSGDYVLITAGSITGSFASAPIWDVAPVNAGHYSIVTSGTTVTLHYNATASPIVTASANPTTLLRNQSTFVTASIIPGDAPINTVTVDLSSLGGSTVSLVQSNASNVYTNMVTIPATAAPGSASVTVTATDTSLQSGSTAIPLTIGVSTEVWNGGGSGDWSDNSDWISGLAPGYSGDTLFFAGSTGLTPNMDANYSVSGLVFSNDASSFTIGTANSSTLTLAGGLTNNSANTQTFNVPVALSGAQTVNAAAGNIALASTVNNGGSVLTVAGANNTTISGTISGGGSLAKVDGGTLTLNASGNSVGGNLKVIGGTMDVTGGSTTFGTSLSYVGYLANSGNLNITGGTFTNGGELWVGGSDQNGATYNAAGTLTVSGGATVSLGKLTIARGNNNQNTVSGTVTLDSGSISSENDIFMGFAGAGTAKIVVNGGTLSVATATKRWVILGQWDTTGSEIDINNGQMNINANTDIRFATSGNDGTNIFNLNGGAVTFYSDNATTIGGSGVVDLHQGNGSTVNNTFNLNGGTLTVSGIVSANNNGTRRFNFNGGTLKATADNSSFLNLGSGSAAANVRGGGAVIDDGGHAVTIPQPLLHSSIAGDNATDGGLAKLGAGTLKLSGANTYNGNTTVSAGTLELTQATIAQDSTVSVSSGAVLKLDFTVTNKVGALVLDGVTQSPGIYNSNTTPAYIAGSGSLLVPSAIATNPTNITFSVSGNTLSLSWPEDHLGWILQEQTNDLSSGLGANWVDIAGTESITSTNITVDPAIPAAFYRLRAP